MWEHESVGVWELGGVGAGLTAFKPIWSDRPLALIAEALGAGADAVLLAML